MLKIMQLDRPCCTKCYREQVLAIFVPMHPNGPLFVDVLYCRQLFLQYFFRFESQLQQRFYSSPRAIKVS